MSRFRVVARGMALAAALALVVGLGWWNLELRDERGAAQAAAERQAVVLDKLNDSGIYRIAPLADPTGGSVGMVVIHDGAATVMANGLPVNDPDDEVFVLWGAHDAEAGSMVPLGTFDVVESELDARSVSSTSTGLDEYDVYAISREPGRQAPATPSNTIASGTVGS